MKEFDNLWSQSGNAFKQSRIAQRARKIAYGALTCLGRHTMTGMLSASGHQFVDWSAAYRLFTDTERLDTAHLFTVVRQNLLKQLDENSPLVVHIDDTLIRKRGRKVSGTSWHRDPLGPHFQTNLIWGQRFLQLSMAVPEGQGACRCRAIPIDFKHCPTLKKPRKKDDQTVWRDYQRKHKQMKLSHCSSERIELLRQQLNKEGFKSRQLIVSADGGHTNSGVLRSLPDNVTLIGRIRKDAKLYSIPNSNCNGLGRKRVYGNRLQTPEQFRQDDSLPWQQVKAWAAGKVHDFDVKVINNVRSRNAGPKHNLKLVVIRPIGYRLSKKSPVLYRNPAYLICTNPNLDIQHLVQAYIWRWEIEVNFRDEKTLIGCGEAQVRQQNAVENLPAFIVAMYAFLLLSMLRCCKKGDQLLIPRPRWYLKKSNDRTTTSEMINLLRSEMWNKALGSNFSSFVNQQRYYNNHKKLANPATSALFYIRK